MLGKVGALTAHRLQPGLSAGVDTHERPDPLPVAPRAFESHLDPVPVLGSVGPQQDQRPAVAGDRQVQVAIVVEIGNGNAAAIEELNNRTLSDSEQGMNRAAALVGASNRLDDSVKTFRL